MIRVIGILIAVLVFVSCSDDKGTNNPTNNSNAILPVDIGNNWIYESYSLDSNFNRIRKIGGLDSILVTGTTMKIGKSAAVLSTYTDSNGVYTKTKEDFYYNDNARLYVHSDYLAGLLPQMVSAFIDFEEQWLLIADENDNDWTVTEQDIDTVTIIVAKVAGNLTIRGKKSADKEFIIDGVKVMAKEFILEGKFAGKAVLPGVPLPFPLDYKVKVHLFFARGIGLVNSIMETSPFEVPLFITIPGFKQESNLIRYKKQ